MIMKAKFLIVIIWLTFLTCSCIDFWAHKIDTKRNTKVIQIYIDGKWYCIPIVEDRPKHNQQDLEDLKNNHKNK